MHYSTAAIHVKTSIVVGHFNLVRMAVTAANAALGFAFHHIQNMSVERLA